MFDAITDVPAPVNEPVHTFAPGSPERSALENRFKQQAAERVELSMTIGGEQRHGPGEPIDVVQPHRKHAVLGTLTNATPDDVRDAIKAARAAASGWQRMSYDDRAAIFLKAADLLAGPWRHTLAAATMLGQSKTCYQAEIDTPCELVDFWRFNVWFGRQIRAEQPISSPGVWNRFDHRPLEGFVLAITPFNFTAIAGNLPTAPALMGNVVLWKPAPTQQLAAHYTMRLLEAAGLPPGVINMITGDGRAVSEVALVHPDLAGIHFTGSTATFGHLWRTVTENRERDLGLPAHPGRTPQARPPRRRIHDPQDPQAAADSTGTAASHRHILAAVPAHSGLQHAGRGLLPRRLRGHLETDLRLLRPRGWQPLRAHPRSDQPSDRPLDYPASPQPADGPRRPCRHVPVPRPRPRRPVHHLVRCSPGLWVPRTTSPSLTSAFAASRPQRHRR